MTTPLEAARCSVTSLLSSSRTEAIEALIDAKLAAPRPAEWVLKVGDRVLLQTGPEIECTVEKVDPADSDRPVQVRRPDGRLWWPKASSLPRLDPAPAKVGEAERVAELERELAEEAEASNTERRLLRESLGAANAALTTRAEAAEAREARLRVAAGELARSIVNVLAGLTSPPPFEPGSKGDADR